MAVPKRSLMIVEWIITTPSAGVCVFCDQQFKVPMTVPTTTSDAQANLQEQFDQHKCKSEDYSEVAA
jgi:hypothetical protein